MIQVTEITNRGQKSVLATAVLADLPEWFGIPESTRAYIEDAEICRFGELMMGTNQWGLSACPILVRIVLRLTVWLLRNFIIDWELAVGF